MEGARSLVAHTKWKKQRQYGISPPHSLLQPFKLTRLTVGKSHEPHSIGQIDQTAGFSPAHRLQSASADFRGVSTAL
jgi:hypothetical protein